MIKNFKFLITKLRLSEQDFKLMNIKCNAFDEAVSKVYGNIETECVEVNNKDGKILCTQPKSTKFVCYIKIRELLKALL